MSCNHFNGFIFQHRLSPQQLCFEKSAENVAHGINHGRFYLPSSLSERSSDSHVGQLVLMRRRLKSALKLFEPSVHIQHRICFSDTERRPTHDLQTCTVTWKMEQSLKDQKPYLSAFCSKWCH